jgi:Ca2+-binding EF-hand superfamily protein
VPLAAAVFGEMLAQIAGAYIERRSDEMEDAFLARALTVGDIEKMDLEKDGRVKPYEFLTYMLVTMQKAEQEEIDEILELFRKLDKDKNGYLNQDDLSRKHHLEISRSTARNSSYMSLWD